MGVNEYYAIAVILLLLGILLYLNRSKIKVQKIFFPFLYLIFYRTKKGLKMMDSLAKKFKNPLKYFGYFGIFIGFVGMAFICFLLIKNIYDLFFVPEAVSAVMPVLPIKAKGIFYIPLIYWLPAIFVLAVIHEFAHGMIARLYNVKLKSAGFAFISAIIPLIPLAFVEPNEKQLAKKPSKQQLSVFAAGSFTNIVFSFLMLGVLALAAAPLNSVFEAKGVIVTDTLKGYPAEQAGMSTNELITSVDGQPITEVLEFTKRIEEKKPGDPVTITTNVSSYSLRLVEHPQKKGMSYLGIHITQNTVVKESFRHNWLVPIIIYSLGFVYILFLLNFGIGLINLAPIGPLDGGRMLKIGLHKFFKPELANRIWGFVGSFFLLLILASLVFSFLN